MSANHDVGFSFSPGGLLFPYHLGVLSILVEYGYVTDQTPLVGSSAGAIAIAAYGAGIPFEEALQSCTRITQKCHQDPTAASGDRSSPNMSAFRLGGGSQNGGTSGGVGGARGKLLRLLEEEMRYLLPDNVHEILNGRPAMVGLAYREIFPRNRAILHSHFQSREDVIEAVCNSSMFPFFTTNLPFGVRPSQSAKQKQILNEQLSSSNNSREIPPNIDDYLPSYSSASSLCSESTQEEDQDEMASKDEQSAISPSPINDIIDANGSSKALSEEQQNNTKIESSESPPSFTPVRSLSNGVQSFRQSFVRLSSRLRGNPTVAASSTEASASTMVSATSNAVAVNSPNESNVQVGQMLSNSIQAISQRVEKIGDNLPRVVVDGYFSTPRERFGCPAFPPEVDVKRTITISCFPHEAVLMTSSEKHDQISPILPKSGNGEQNATVGDVKRTLQKLLIKAATPAKSEKEHLELFENGRKDGKRWIDEEELRKKEKEEEVF